MAALHLPCGCIALSLCGIHKSPFGVVLRIHLEREMAR